MIIDISLTADEITGVAWARERFNLTAPKDQQFAADEDYIAHIIHHAAGGWATHAQDPVVIAAVAIERAEAEAARAVTDAVAEKTAAEEAQRTAEIERDAAVQAKADAEAERDAAVAQAAEAGVSVERLNA